MKRTFIIFGVILVIGLPIVLLTLRNPMISTYLRRTFGKGEQAVTSAQFTTTSTDTKTKITLVDTKYLDYVTAKLGIFDKEAIVDREWYMGNTAAIKKHTVTRVEFVLVDDLDSYVYGATGGKLFAAKGDYAVVGDVLKVSIALFPENVENAVLGSTYPLEQAFLKTAFVTLLYAHGISDPRSTAVELGKLRSDMKEYLESGLFPWPIRIDTQ
jgi:hypothetical protein